VDAGIGSEYGRRGVCAKEREKRDREGRRETSLVFLVMEKGGGFVKGTSTGLNTICH